MKRQIFCNVPITPHTHLQKISLKQAKVLEEPAAHSANHTQEGLEEGRNEPHDLLIRPQAKEKFILII